MRVKLQNLWKELCCESSGLRCRLLFMISLNASHGRRRRSCFCDVETRDDWPEEFLPALPPASITEMGNEKRSRSTQWSIKTPALSQILTAIWHRPTLAFVDPPPFLDRCIITSTWLGAEVYSRAYRCGERFWGVTAPMRTDGVKTTLLH